MSMQAVRDTVEAYRDYSDAWLLGTLDTTGQMMTVGDLRRLLEVAEAEEQARNNPPDRRGLLGASIIRGIG